MKIIFLHLSDLHLQSDSDPILTRADKIAEAIGSVDAIFDACVVAVTGDIAYSGKGSEFELAVLFFDDLHGALTRRYPGKEFKFAFVPGNHDSDFSLDVLPRDLSLEALRRKLSDTQMGDKTLDALLKVQSEFFRFASRWMKFDRDKSWLFHEELVSFDGVQVAVVCYNTACSSQLPEQQGKLFFPTHLANPGAAISRPASMTVALVHHPYNWLEPVSGLALRAQLDRIADLVLTGHQHVESSYSKRDMRGDEVTYFEGAALQDSDSVDTGFSILLADLDEKQIQGFRYFWRHDVYELARDSSRIALPVKRFRNRFDISPDYRHYLSDPGTGFTHPRVQELQLQDIFVFPDLSRLSIEKSVAGKDTPEIVRGRAGLEFLLAQDKVFVSGGDQAGKTTLAKILFNALWNASFVPVLLSGDQLQTVKEQPLIKLINGSFSRQYSEESLESYKRLEKAKKVLIVDGWHQVNLNAQGKVILGELFAKMFGRIVILSGESFRIEEIGRQAQLSNPFSSFQFCEIREFGHVLRGRLIEKWLSIGRDYSWDVNAHAHDIHETEKLLATLLGKNLIPSYPVNILAILQAFEARRSTSTPSGSYGYLYEALLTLALSRVASDSIELDLMYTFISRLAYFLFTTDRKMLSRADVESVGREYFDEYSINIDISDYLDRLEVAHILLKLEGNYGFRYRYIYYYFVARYFQESLRAASVDSGLKKKLYEMADQLYFEDYSGILMFVLYLTKDADLISHIVANADSIYREKEPFDFETHVGFINQMYKEAPKVLISSADLERNREEYRKKLDEDREVDSFVQVKNEKFAYNDNLPDVAKFNIAFKTLQLLGQVLRNFPGSLHKDIKMNITRSCYSLGLRVMRAVMKIAEDNLGELRLYVAEIIKDHRPLLSDGELTKTTDEAVIWLTRRAAFGLIKRVSYSVGLELLNETYKRVLEASNRNMSVRLIDLSVKLDHFRAFPEDDIDELWDASRKNYFLKTVIRDMVAQFIYLFGLENYKTLQSIGAKLDIKVADPKFRNPGNKKLKK